MYMPLVSLPSHMQAWDALIYNTDKYHKNIKVGYESHDMRIGAMIVGVRSTKQSSGIIIDCICSQQE